MRGMFCLYKRHKPTFPAVFFPRKIKALVVCEIAFISLNFLRINHEGKKRGFERYEGVKLCINCERYKRVRIE